MEYKQQQLNEEPGEEIDLKQSTIILGAGIAGLRCAQKLSADKKIIVVEKRKQWGGLATSFKHKEFTFDIGPHKIYSILPGIMNEFKEILGSNCLVVDKKNSIHLQGHYYSFPIKPFQLLKQFNPLIGIKCGLSYAGTLTKRKTKDYIVTYEDYFLNGFGKEAYELLFRDIAHKVWGDPKKLSADLAERRIPLPSITKMAQQLFSKKVKPEVSASQFYYPKKGIGMVCDTLANEIKQNEGEIQTETVPSMIEIKNSRVTSITLKNNDKENKIDHPENIISTIHLIDLIDCIKPTPPEEVLKAAKNLKYRSSIIVYLIINKPKLLEDHWLFFPEKKFIFTRVAESKNFSNHTAPADKTAITAEVGCEFQDEIYNLTQKELYERVIKDLEIAGITKKEEVGEYFTIKINKCYPVYDIEYKENLTKILKYIDSIENLYVIGRQGLFNYNNTDHSIDMANRLANHILARETKEMWKKTREIFESYRIID